MSETLSERYAVISSDGHAGADLRDYRPYLASQWHDEFDAWAPTYVNPFADLQSPTAYRSWDSERRLEETEADGIVAEVLFPNTVPPFFDSSQLTALPPTEADYERRWAGVQAHNRWMVDFCAAAPGRRAGVFQVFANRIEDALAEIRWAVEQPEMTGGVLLPSVPPNAGLPGFWEAYYDPMWQLCEDHGIPVQVHGGGGLPDYGEHIAARAMMLIELPWFAHRPVWHLIFGGVLERFPNLKIVLTEQGMAWLPRGLETLDWFHRRMTMPDSAESLFFGEVAAGMTMKPSEYFARNFWMGASFLRPSEAPIAGDVVAVDRVMWGADYPHSEGSLGYTTEALRAGFGDKPVDEARAMIETNAADFFGFDLDALRPLADRIGPRVDEVARPIAPDDYPPSTCNAFDKAQVLRSW